MARTHARVKGKSGSTRPVNADLSLVSLKKEEVESLIIKLASDDVKPSMIGLVLRDKYAVPSVKAVCGKSIGKILEEKKLSLNVPEDLASLVERAKKLKKHLEFNSRDVHNKRGLLLVESKIRRLSAYYKKTGKMPANWSMN